MEYAIIEQGGRQYRVQKGDSVLVDRIDAKEGAKVSPRAILYRSSDAALIDGPDLAKVKVEAVVAEHLKGEKIRIFKYKAKKRYRKRGGHRSLLTRLEITGINGPAGSSGSKAKATRAKPAAKKKESAAAGAGKPAAEATAEEKQDSKES
jgi:large subunit ribosomal protein L21